MSLAPQVAISSDFLSAFSTIPRKQQGKVMDFVSRFRSHPDSPGINFERIRDARDENLRSVRIDDTYRGIVLHPPSGNLYVLLWVDHHDDAYSWARNRKCSVHPETGSLQVFEVQERVLEAARAEEEIPPLFEGVREKYLLRMGIPEEVIPAVTALRSEEELEALAETLPPEAADALSLLNLGFSPDEILQDLELKKPDAKVDTEDFAKALRTDEARSRFFVAEDDLELQAILQAPLERWRVFLHPSQRKVVERDWNGPVRVLGGAGTGKTVAAIHRARWLVQTVLNNDSSERVLFTTFTVNLAEDIRSNLAKLCSDEVMKQIEVVNLDRWVSQFLKARGYELKFLYNEEEKREDFWRRAMTYAPREPVLPESFFPEEWEKVIQPQEITNEREYFQGDRRGRGTGLDRKQRKALWPVFEEYRALLTENGYSESDDAMRDARKLIETSGEKLPYRSIVVDEAQDLGPLAFRLLRRMVPEGKNDLFIVGDAHQRIYKRQTVLSRCGVEVRGRSRKLRINYRTTEETRRWAMALLEGRDFDDLDGGLDDHKGYRSLLRGQPPRLEGFATFDEEADFLGDYLKELRSSGEPLQNVCLAARTRTMLKAYRSALEERGIESVEVKADRAEDRRREGLRMATMHRVKGLEFDRMIIAGAEALPHRSVHETDDPAEARERDTMERSLAYVAATRARTHLLVTWNGKRPEMLGDSGACHERDSDFS